MPARAQSPYAALNKRLTQITDRLAVLISESEDPKAEMFLVARMLFDAGLSDYQPGPKTSPQAFAQTVIEDNPQMFQRVSELNQILRLSQFETAEQLTNALLPAGSLE